MRQGRIYGVYSLVSSNGGPDLEESVNEAPFFPLFGAEIKKRGLSRKLNSFSLPHPILDRTLLPPRTALPIRCGYDCATHTHNLLALHSDDGGGCCGHVCFLVPMTSSSHNNSTTEQMGSEQCDLSEKKPQISSGCLDSKQRELGTVLNNSVIDEKSNHISANVTENSVIQLLAPPQHDLDKSRQIVEGPCLQRSTIEQVSINLSNDKPENKCQPLCENIQTQPVEINDAVNAFVVEDQMQSIAAEGSCLQQSTIEQVSVHLDNDKPENECQALSENVQTEPVEINDAAFVVEDQTQSIPVEGSCLPQNTIEQVSVQLFNDKPENECQPLSENVQTEPVEINDAAFVVEDQTQSIPVEGSCLPQNTIEQISVQLFNDKPENECQPLSENVQTEPVEINNAVTSLVVKDQTQFFSAQVNTSSVNELLGPPSGNVAKNISFNCSERKPNSTTHSRLRHRGKRNSKLLKKKYMLRSLGSSDRALRSRTREKPKAPEPNSNLVDGNNDGVKRKSGRRKKKRREDGITDQFSRIRTHLRYLLNRISYEKSLIDAYSGEGWKGYSMEKLKPEKELQRAKSEILRRKLKIRDLFRNLDSLCAEGKLPESLFDSKGEIDSEDIFCAKCQSKELSTNNDIILCDGVCDRGFHQFCLDPPLLTEDIPPGDEGWLCPGCECKDDCIELVNDSLGSSLSLSDTWERVFPEAATAAGNNMDSNLGLPSDDSDDDDYNPNGPEDVEVEGDESSSDESEYASASEKLQSSHEDQYLGLPSEDSEDDDYDPNRADVDCKIAEESSSSDFTSDSEDLAAIQDKRSPGQDEDIVSVSLDDVKNLKGSGKQKGKVDKKPSMADELSSLLEPDPGQEGSTPVSGKRHVERLDYKRLYDETYRSDTSEDEDWTATATPSSKKKLTANVTLVSPNGNASNNPRHTPMRNTHQNRAENTDNSPAKSVDSCVKYDSRDNKSGSSAYKRVKRLGEVALQRLHKSFKENQYPDRTTKESLAQELGITFQQVAKWFDNTRWSFRHSSQMESDPGKNILWLGNEGKAKNEGERKCELMSPEVSGENSKSSSYRKRKHLSESQASETQLDIDGSATSTPNAHEIQIGNKMKTRKRK
ncbi:homeobox protein HAZ1 [Abrus precatorius]|uniref:Homeobox protein HAZ1 n=1 Tax=Abrus precatorius TaxID=3816 RepID=A0A8B8MCC7_ABRPR|nr:homeobox protein HAZ1 [Abrus precatorius]